MKNDELPIQRRVIALDGWKAPIFERLLEKAGYRLGNSTPPGQEFSIFTFYTTDPESLSQIVRDLNREAAKQASSQALHRKE